MDIQALRALYNQAHGIGPLTHKGSGGGASDHARAMMAARLRSSGMPEAMVQQRMGGNPFGRSVGDEQVLKWAMGQGLQVPGVSDVLGGLTQQAQRRTEKGEPTALDRLLMEAQMAHNQAQMANEARYQQGLGLLEDSYERNTGELKGLRDRVDERLENYGSTEKALNTERSGENLEAIKANLAQRGLLNSTVLPAFMGRSERDLSLLNNSVDERAAAQRAQYDAQISQNLANLDRGLTQDQVSFIEARHDRGPDYGMLMKMAERYGLGNQGQGFQRRGGTAAVPRGVAPAMIGGPSLAPLLANHGYAPRSPRPSRPKQLPSPAQMFRGQRAKMDIPRGPARNPNQAKLSDIAPDYLGLY